jgi:hypothetical protein
MAGECEECCLRQLPQHCGIGGWSSATTPTFGLGSKPRYSLVATSYSTATSWARVYTIHLHGGPSQGHLVDKCCSPSTSSTHVTITPPPHPGQHLSQDRTQMFLKCHVHGCPP